MLWILTANFHKLFPDSPLNVFKICIKNDTKHVSASSIWPNFLERWPPLLLVASNIVPKWLIHFAFFKRKLSFSSRKLVRGIHIFGRKYSFLLGHCTAGLGNSKRVPYLIQCRLKYPSFFRMGHQHQCRTFLHFCRPCANLFSRASRVQWLMRPICKQTKMTCNRKLQKCSGRILYNLPITYRSCTYRRWWSSWTTEKCT